MEFVVAAAFVAWLVVVIVAFWGAPGRTFEDEEINERKRSKSNET